MCEQIAAENNYVPVVATIATDDKGQALNINADTAAGEVRRDMKLVSFLDQFGRFLL